LPAVSSTYGFEKRREGPFAVEVAELCCPLQELGEIEIEMVSSRYSKASKTWNHMMDQFHPLGRGALSGGQIRYLVRSVRYGLLGGVSFSAATWALKDRDKYIGWSDGARSANLGKVLCNSRFLIVPSVRVDNLASFVLSRCSRRIAQDWQRLYGVRPVLVETFVDPTAFTGACYRAANWQRVGRSSGRRGSGPKEIYLYGLCKQWKWILCEQPPPVLGKKGGARRGANWAEEEFETAQFYDSRLQRRLVGLAQDFYAQPQALIPQVCGSESKGKAAYRFFVNKKVTMETVLKGHIDSTVQRIKEHPVVLAVQDTTTFNYSAYPSMEGLGPINTKKDKAVGLLLHDTMAFTPQGTPLGLINVQCWARDKNTQGKRERRKELPIEEKESMKWLKSYRAACEIQKLCPDTMVISAGDREADIYELFLEAEQRCDGPHLLIRCDRGRNRKSGNEYLWDKMATQPVEAIQLLQVPRKGSRPARQARLELRYGSLALNPPKGKGYPPVDVWLVYAKEVNYGPDVKEPLDWMLLSTVPVRSIEDACQRLQWYTKRWCIEIYHRTLKSGCNIKDRRLASVDRMEGCLALDMVIAWRVHHLTYLARETPHVPCTTFFEEAEWKALHVFVRKTLPDPNRVPPLNEFVRMVASLGGFLGRKCDGEPGVKSLWRGLQRHEDITFTYRSLLPYLRAGP